VLVGACAGWETSLERSSCRCRQHLQVRCMLVPGTLLRFTVRRSMACTTCTCRVRYAAWQNMQLDMHTTQQQRHVRSMFRGNICAFISSSVNCWQRAAGNMLLLCVTVFLQGLGVSTVGELAAVPLPRLEALVGLENAAWLQRLAQVRRDCRVLACMLASREHNTNISCISCCRCWMASCGVG
jgi:hypothetical protein